MGKLSTFQRQVQDTVDRAIKKTEKTYIYLAAKPFKLSRKFHSLHDDGVTNTAGALRKLNKQFGEISLKLITKIEKEETKTERAKRVNNNAGKKTRKNVNSKATAAKKAVKSQTEKLEEAFA